MAIIIRFRARFETEEQTFQAAQWVKTNITNITGAGGNSEGDLTFETTVTTFTELVDTISSVRSVAPNVKYNFELV